MTDEITSFSSPSWIYLTNARERKMRRRKRERERSFFSLPFYPLLLCNFRFLFIHLSLLFDYLLIEMVNFDWFLCIQYAFRLTCVQLLLMGCTGSKHELSKEDLEFLKAHTSYSEKKIRTWYKGFMVKRKSNQKKKNKLDLFSSSQSILERLSQRRINTRFIHPNLQAILSQRTRRKLLRTCFSCFRHW